MNLDQLLPRIQNQPAFELLVDRLRGGESGSVPLSAMDAAKPYVIAAVHDALKRSFCLVVPRPSQARTLYEEIACWHPGPSKVLLFPERDALPYEPLSPDPQTTAERLAVLTRLIGDQELGVKSQGLAARGKEAVTDARLPTPDSRPLVVASGRAVAELLIRPEDFSRHSMRLRVGDPVRPDDLLRRWLDLGYEPAPVVDSPGQFSRRGGIVDVYPLVGEAYRIEFFGDEIESLRTFDPVTQRSTAPVSEVLVTPSAEALTAGSPSRKPGRGADGVRASKGATLLDYLPPDAVLALDEPAAIAAAADDFEQHVAGLREDLLRRGELDPETSPPFLEWRRLGRQIAQLTGQCLEIEHDPDAETFGFVHPAAFGGRVRHFVQECQRLGAERRQVVIVTQQAQRLQELFEETADHETRGRGDAGTRRDFLVSASPRLRVSLIQGQLQAGWQSLPLALSVFTDNEIFGWHKIRRRTRPRRAVGRQTFLSELTPGDLVVHVEHGIGRYRGMVTMAGPAHSDGGPRQGREAAEREYLLLEYAEGGRLYVPAEQADRVSRYVGAGDAAPTPTRLGSGEWARAKNRVRRAVREIAQELLTLYATRQNVQGHQFPADTTWQSELEASFPYVETPDQLKALEEVKEDMQRVRPMDRLLVGDVGYGKTEIALRAAFKSVEAGKQVAVLAPTTVLAQQHWQTFRERLGAFPVRVEMLSRFRSESEQREVTQGLASGTVDICIGTHRLLQKDVSFKDLGLTIVDEEQRFGVAHKERLKQLRREVDVLTLSATPIPRTLHMSLVGVRDMSTIETPPEERQPIRTYVMEYDEGLVREAILRELDRGGQAYYVHNRVQSIEQEARRLRKLLPEARIAIGHGQMPEEQLERVMLEFAAGEHDMLVCTTIIESGLDIPSVNTLIVNNAHRFGLSQLYQLRGRVGRAAVRAYAYLMYTRDSALTESAEKRLRTIFEATELGAGFRIALKDLEIRGAGNLLGAEQHGHISAVGFDLYTRLLAEAVEQLKQAHVAGAGERAPMDAVPAQVRPLLATPRPSAAISLPLSAYLPDDYVADEPTRLNFYQRLAAVTAEAQLAELMEELVDRFGPPPEAVRNLAYVVSLRLAAERASVQQVQSVDGEVVVKFERLPSLDIAALSRVVGASLRAGSNQIRLPKTDGRRWMDRLQALVNELPGARPS